MVPMTGLEPALPKKTDFESVASTNSATSALCFQGRINPIRRLPLIKIEWVFISRANELFSMFGFSGVNPISPVDIRFWFEVFFHVPFNLIFI